MGGLTLDIATKIIPASENIWSMFPGIGKKFLNEFVANNVIFLDTPVLNLTPPVLANEELLRQHVAMSQHWVRYLRGADKTVPSRRAANYSPPKSASFSAAVGNVRNVFVRMQAGDLVLVAGRDFYEAIHVGEIVGQFRPDITVTVRAYGREEIPARRVRWLRQSIERRYLSQRLSNLLSNRKAVVSVSKAEFGDEVFRIAYGDYVFGTNSRYIFSGPKYNNIAPSAVPGIELISYFCAAFNACDIGEMDQFSQLDILDAIDKYFEQDVLHSFEIDFQSPGAYILHAKRAALPLLVAVLVEVTGGGISLDEARAAQIQNSAGGAGVAQSDACNLEIESKYSAIMQSINYDRYMKICKLNEAARDGVGLNVNVKRK